MFSQLGGLRSNSHLPVRSSQVYFPNVLDGWSHVSWGSTTKILCTWSVIPRASSRQLAGRIFPCFIPCTQTFSFRFMIIRHIFWHIYLNLCYYLITIIAVNIVALYLLLCKIVNYYYTDLNSTQQFDSFYYYYFVLIFWSPYPPPAVLRVTTVKCTLIRVVVAKNLVFNISICWPRLFIVLGQNSDPSQFSKIVHSCILENFPFIFSHRCCTSSGFLLTA